MSSPASNRTTGVPFMLGGVFLAAFILLHPFDALAGAHGALMETWIPAHTLHFLGALFALFGLVQLRERWSSGLDGIGRAGILVALVGTAMFVGTGMITAFVWPVIAHHDSSFIAASGPMFTDPLTARSIEATYGCLVVGYVLLALGLARARLLTVLDSAAVGVGILLFSAPVEPVGPAPWIVRVAGGVVFGAGLVRTGMAMRAVRSATRSETSARVDARTRGAHP
jgi:hypothetical protein